jgi:hypothetical protein
MNTLHTVCRYLRSTVFALGTLCQNIWVTSFCTLVTLFLSNPYLGQAQCPNATVPRTFKTWNWEELPYNSTGGSNDAYCNTWQANIATGSGIVPTSMRAPWDISAGPGLIAIAKSNDYRKADGWELIRFDFGGLGSVPVPYFILYHRTTGVLRIFAYISDTNGLTGAKITMTHSSNDQNFSGHSAASFGLTRDLLQAPDKYLTQSSLNNAPIEQATYVCFLGGRSNWTMGQFTMVLDPNVTNGAYDLNMYQIQVSGVIQSTVQLDGEVQFKTNISETSDFAFSGPVITPKPSSVAGAGPKAQDFTLDSFQKFLGDVSSIGTKITDINDKADKTAKAITATNGILGDVKLASEKVRDATQNSTLKAITGVASQLGGIFGLAGSIIGLFTSDASSTKSAFIPTVSKGTITLKGTITTNSPLHTFYLMTPGTIHYDRKNGETATTQSLRSALPYYNCALGIFNITNTPILYKGDYQRIDTEYLYYDQNLGEGSGDAGRPHPYSTYKLNSDIRPIVNANSGLEIKSVKVAIAQKVLLSSLSVPYENDFYFTDGFDDGNHVVHNFVYAQVASGALEVYPYDPGKAADGSQATVILQTPFEEAACAKTSLAGFNIPTPSSTANPVYLRLIAELHQIGTPSNSAPIYFAQDYAIEISSVDLHNSTANLNNRPLFNQFYSYGYNLPENLYLPNTTKSGGLQYDNNKLSETANENLIFDQNANVTIGQTNGLPVLFQAGKSVSVTGELSAPPGTQLTISTDYRSLGPDFYTCSGVTYDISNIPCGYDNDALRLAGPLATTNATSLDSPILTLAPNPASTSTLMQLQVSGTECIEQADLLNTQGQVLWHQVFTCSHKLATDVPLNGLPTGVYIMRVITSARTYTSKLTVN